MLIRRLTGNVRVPTGLQAITRTRDGFFSGTDPRREGLVAGD